MIVGTHSPQSDCTAPVHPSIPVGPTVESVSIQALERPEGTAADSAFDDVPGPTADITVEAAFIGASEPADRSPATTGPASVDVPELAGGALVPTGSATTDAPEELADGSLVPTGPVATDAPEELADGSLVPTGSASLDEHRAAVLRRRDEAERLGDDIAELAARIQAATYELLVMIRAFDEREGWSGFKSCAHWLNWRTGLALGAAREKVRVARALQDLPLLSDAMRRGRISYSKVRALTRVATAANERRLLGFAECAPASYVERLARAWRRVDLAEEATDERRRHERRQLATWVDDDGMVVIRGRLSPEVGAVVRRALEAAGDRLWKEAPREEAAETSYGQRQADALGLVAESALAADLDRGTAGDRYQVVLHVDAETLRAGTGGWGSEVRGLAPVVHSSAVRALAPAAATAGTTAKAPSGEAAHVSAETRRAAETDVPAETPAGHAASDIPAETCRAGGSDVSAETLTVAAADVSAETPRSDAAHVSAETLSVAAADVPAETPRSDAAHVSAETLTVAAADVPAETSPAAAADVSAQTRRSSVTNVSAETSPAAATFPRRRRPDTPLWKTPTDCASPRRPLGGWRATRGRWSYSTPRTARSSTWAARPAPSRRPCGGRCRRATGSADSRAATRGAATRTMSATGPTAGGRGSTTSCCSAATITGRFTRRASPYG